MNEESIAEGFETMDFDTLEMLQQANVMNPIANGVASESFAWEAMQQQWGVNPVYEVLQVDDGLSSDM